MKILIPTADYPPIEGGISTVALQLSRELAALGHDVTVIAPHFPGQAEWDAREPAVVRRYRGYGLGWFRLIPLLAAAWPHARRADLILGINVAYGGVLGWLSRRIHGVRYVTFAYAYEFLKFRRTPVVARLLKRVYARAALVVAISQFTRDNLTAFGASPHNIATILPGAPKPHALSGDALAAARRKFVLEGRRVILAVGRLVARKGHRTLVRALPRILERVPDAQLVIVGRGPCLSDVVQDARNLGVRDHVLLAGHLDDEDVAALYAVCDVFALPAGVGERGQVEGFGLVFAEAHAYAKPVVAGRSGGVVDAVLDGETGLLVEPDDPEALAGAVLRILEDPALARRLGENGRRRVESELNWAEFTRRLLDALETAP
ncbi:MAG: glycosyltransferase family 4 protein [Candidatus Hydrogenedentes bacterium]|nr:glycosyltransferase family 4 protein [Candidatus Hydrogenedentota bacterium]